ncbi:molybdopterin oxidoreductase [Natronococcus pandeyae]|uniref:Molybdopterin oxidoreductase n=1 Tax=Natronococcus pandeyae TaxID=2055836 RepID=A0A8J8TPU3_9EURY|nr:molybdopterin-dependent oxidoreductase [Natronococcus pandeyae]TYL37793.1 molybdopterin oxidoreductase [Natronococcus pandeyae]
MSSGETEPAQDTGDELGRADEQPSRRFVLKAGAAAAATGLAGCAGLFSDEDPEVDDPDDEPMNVFEEYPDRDWEEYYRDIWDVDDTFMLTCTPNDTHNCYLEAHVKNDVITRLGPSMNYGGATDLHGNEASDRWDPRVCQKGLAMIERFYGDQRVHAPMVREGFREWVEDGFPRDDDGSMPEEYAGRGTDSWEEVSFDEAYDLAAETILEIADFYSGEDGQEALLEQEYHERVVEETGGAGIQTMKFRGGMPLLGMIRLFGLYRVANQMALVDYHVRDVDEDEAIGGVGLDNYSWHTDLPPGHTMVTGQQTVDFDLANVEYADNIVIAGMNWITTKMADSHWLTEARMKGAKVTGVFTDYNATATKCDEIITVRPGTDSALFLGAAKIIVEEDLYDETFVREQTDLPILVRTDENRFLRAHEVFEDYEAEDLEKSIVVEDDEERPDAGTIDVWENVLTEDLREGWGDFVVHDADADEYVPVTRDEIGDDFDVEASLEGTFEVETVDGETVEVRPVFDLVAEHLLETWDAESTAEVTGTDPDAVEDLARDMADNQGTTLLLKGMGPNHHNNQDQKDRSAFLLASLTSNIGNFGGNIGSYAGNYRGAYFNGNGQWTDEDPFDPELDPDEPAPIDSRSTSQSAHWYSHGDRPLAVDEEYYMGDSHMFTPTKFLWTAGSNSILGNAKGSFDIIENMLRNGRIEALFTNEWWWTKTCEYSDIVFPADSWAEYHVHDITASVTNPFVMAMPETGLEERIYETRNDAQIYQGVAEALAERTDDDRFADYWAFIDEDEYQGRPYLQRVIDHSNTVAGYDIDDLIERAEEGEPRLIMTGTYPKFVGGRQTHEDDPWYTKTGRLEFFREEPEFTEAGENIPLHREPVDATFYEPNAIVASDDNPAIDPETPADRGWDDEESVRDGDVRQIRNVVYTPDELTDTEHPLRALDDGFEYTYMTPKFRHGAHTFSNSLPNIAVWWGPFGDMDREDERKPFVGEGYLNMNPEDAQEEGLEDGDYVYLDADPQDRPYRGWDEDDEGYHVARALMRVRYQPSLPRGVTRSWFNLNEASHGSVEAHEERDDGLARNEETDYQALYRYGGHQSATRTWFRRTMLTDEMPRKEYGGQNIGVGYAADIHCANGAPKESFVRVERAEEGGEDGEGLWRPAEMGLRPTYEDDEMEQYLNGEFLDTGGD